MLSTRDLGASGGTEAVFLDVFLKAHRSVEVTDDSTTSLHVDINSHDKYQEQELNHVWKSQRLGWSWSEELPLYVNAGLLSQ